MAANNAPQAKSAKEELLELLEKKPKIYKDAVKWTLARWSGISFSSLFDNLPPGDLESMVRELKEDDLFRIIDDSKRSSEVIIQVTEKGRDSIIGVFYSKSEQRELKRLFKKFDDAFASKTAPQAKT
jgi:hypothetical protein